MVRPCLESDLQEHAATPAPDYTEMVNNRHTVHNLKYCDNPSKTQTALILNVSLQRCCDVN